MSQPLKITSVKRSAQIPLEITLFKKKEKKKSIQSSSVEKTCYTHTLPNVNAKVSMDVCISPNIAFVFSGVTSLKLIPVQSDKIEEKNLSHNKTASHAGLSMLHHSSRVFRHPCR